jgi:hypothetical protein
MFKIANTEQWLYIYTFQEHIPATLHLELTEN